LDGSFASPNRKDETVNKVVFGLILGGVLGVLDGLTALFSAPETKAQIASIVVGSTIKGLIAGVIIGWFARKVRSVKWGVVFGLFVGLLLAFLVAVTPDESGKHYYVEIMLPGSIVGLIVGYATQKYRAATTV
jgi:LytS/YehU family sensor histidine kinase